MNVRTLGHVRAASIVVLSVIVALVSMAARARGASPTVSTAPGSSGACGGPGDLCEPGVDVLANYPPVAPVVSPLPFGLVPGDDISGLSWGVDDIFNGTIRFSVDTASFGAPSGLPPPSSVVWERFPGPGDVAGDIFRAGTVFAPAANVLEVEADGVPMNEPAGPPAFGLLDATSASPPHDDIDALATCDPSERLAAGFPAFFTLAPGSPTLAALSATPADILIHNNFGTAIKWGSAALGLAPGDVIDALATDYVFSVAFSLAPGSPTLSLMLPPCFGGAPVAIGPAHVLGSAVTFGSLCVLVPVFPIALLSTDNIDALDMAVDLDSDVVNDLCDNCVGVANNDQANSDGDVFGDACDPCPGDPINDPDLDSLCAGVDNCPFFSNPGQADADGDGNGDGCDLCAGDDTACEQQANTYTFDDQRAPDVCRNDDGDFVIVWESATQDGYQGGIFGQRFDSAGAPTGTEFQANTYTNSEQYLPAVACDAAGRFVVVWTDAYRDGYDLGVFGRRFDSTGSAIGSDFQINTQTAYREGYPSVAMTAGGAFVVVWQADDVDGDGYGVQGQRFASNGAPIGGEFLVNTHTADRQTYSAVAVGPGGGFVVVWASLNQDGASSGIFGQRFDAAGAGVGSEFQVNSHTIGYQGAPSVGVAADGRFVVTWFGPGDGDGAAVQARQFSSAGVGIGVDIQVNVYTYSHQTLPDITVAPGGDFNVVWESQYQDGGGQQGVFGRSFSSSGAPKSPEFQINTQTLSNQRLPAVASDAAGNFVAVWQNPDLDGFGDGIFYRLFDAPGPCAPAPIGGCETPAKSKLLIKNKSPDDNDKLLWKFLKGAGAVDQVDLADPTASTIYTLCLYDMTGLRETIQITNPAWSPIGDTGYKYNDPLGQISGLTKMILKGGTAGKPKAIVKGKGSSLPDLLPMPFPVTVRLINPDTGKCFGDTYNTGISDVDQVNAKNG